MGRKAKTPYMQINLGDRFLALSKRGQETTLNRRLGHFGDETFPRIDPDVFMALYSDHGRGPSYLQGLVGAYPVMNMWNLTADELILRIDSDIAIQYALHTTSLEKQPFPRRNLFYFIDRLEDDEKRTGINLIEESLCRRAKQPNQSENGAFIPKPNKDISGSSLQSPEDPAATARTKAGKTHVGFVANVTETYDEDGNSLITDADMQPDTYSDSDFMKDSIRSKKNPVNEEHKQFTIIFECRGNVTFFIHNNNPFNLILCTVFCKVLIK